MDEQVEYGALAHCQGLSQLRHPVQGRMNGAFPCDHGYTIPACILSTCAATEDGSELLVEVQSFRFPDLHPAALS